MFRWRKNRAEEPSHLIPTVGFDATKVSQAVKTDLRHNIESLAEVDPNSFTTIYDAALQSISAGRALHILYQALLTIDGISKARAEEISLSLNNKATSLMKSQEQEELGIKYAYWIYSGAPCGNPDQDAAHRSANRQPYLVNKGLFLNGRWTLPGREDGCKCISKSVIVGIDGYSGGIPIGFEK